MQLPRDVRARLAKEYRFVADSMRATEEAGRKLFFFSGLSGEANRACNWSWDRDVNLIHAVCQVAHQQISARIQTGVGAPELPPNFFEALTQAADDFATYVSSGKDDPGALLSILGRVSELQHLTTGNGGYLYQKGAIKP